MDKTDRDEIVACFHESDLPKFHTGKLSSLVFPATREEKVRKNLPFLICRIYAFTLSGKCLIQRRSATRKILPLTFCDSASGHIQYRENFSFDHIQEEAWRELAEEMGAKVLYGRLLDINVEHNRKVSCELAYNFIALIEDSFQLDNDETDPESGLYSKDQCLKLLDERSFVPVTKEYWSYIFSRNLHQKMLSEYHLVQTRPKKINSNQNFIPTDLKIPKYSIGALVGRFQPFHNGHLQLILGIINQVETIKIGIGSSQSVNTPENPFSFDERKQMIIDSLDHHGIIPSIYTIYAIPDLHNITKWTESLMQIFGDFDIFYSNNEWIRQFLLNYGKKIGSLMKFDFERFNGTFIRAQIKADRAITDLLPISVITIMRKIQGFQRIKEL